MSAKPSTERLITKLLIPDSKHCCIPLWLIVSRGIHSKVMPIALHFRIVRSPERFSIATLSIPQPLCTHCSASLGPRINRPGLVAMLYSIHRGVNRAANQQPEGPYRHSLTSHIPAFCSFSILDTDEEQRPTNQPQSEFQ